MEYTPDAIKSRIDRIYMIANNKGHSYGSQRWFAREAGISEGTVYGWTTGQRSPRGPSRRVIDLVEEKYLGHVRVLVGEPLPGHEDYWTLKQTAQGLIVYICVHGVQHTAPGAAKITANTLMRMRTRSTVEDDPLDELALRRQLEDHGCDGCCDLHDLPRVAAADVYGAYLDYTETKKEK